MLRNFLRNRLLTSFGLVVVTFLISIFLILFDITKSKSETSEKNEIYYQQKWCDQHNGKIIVNDNGNIMVTCLTDTNVIQTDFANNWKNSIGKSLNFSSLLNKKAGILLIIKSVNQYKYWYKLNNLINRFNLPIDVWKYEDFDSILFQNDISNQPKYNSYSK